MDIVDVTDHPAFQHETDGEVWFDFDEENESPLRIVKMIPAPPDGFDW
jgi:hypothetical protein